MLPREKYFRRKEVIARKRIERAEKRDCLAIDMADIAAMMREFAETEGSVGSLLQEHGVRTDDGDSGSDFLSDEDNADAALDCAIAACVPKSRQSPSSQSAPAAAASEVSLQAPSQQHTQHAFTAAYEQASGIQGHSVRDTPFTQDRMQGGVQERGKSEYESQNNAERAPALHELSVEGLVEFIDGGKGHEADHADDDMDALLLPPLSGPHLKAAKRLAGYLRLSWQARGNGTCKILALRRTADPSPADVGAIDELLVKLERDERGAATKRRPL